MTNAYGDDLAYIHDTGYGDFARNAAPGVLALLRQQGIEQGLVIDLGCGSGIWAERLLAAGYDVLGFDISAAMIALARARVPGGEFHQVSFLTAPLPTCVAVTSLGECFSYLFESGKRRRGLLPLFRRIRRALSPGGLLIFDVVEPGRIPGSGPRQHFRAAADWAVLVTAEEDRRRRLLTRDITSFRKVGILYRRDHEVHRLRLYDRAVLTRQLRGLGFGVRVLAGYGRWRFLPGQVGFVARQG